MATLVCEFPDKLRFYDQVLKRDHRRIFVETLEELISGTHVDLEIRFQNDAAPLSTKGKVVAKRTRQGAAGVSSPGVWVQLSPQDANALKGFIEIQEGEADHITGRTTQRFEFVAPVSIEKPINRSVKTLDVSEGGVRLDGALGAPVGQTIRMRLSLGQGDPVTTYGRVAWRREDLGTTGVQFRFQDDETKERVTRLVQDIAKHDDWLVYAKRSVLVVDDDPATLRALERVLSVKGYATQTAETGPEALCSARETPPALILLDVLLPGMNGIEVCRILKRDAVTSRVPVALTSVLDSPQLEALTKEAGALAALPKPYRLDTLVNLVERVVDQKQSLTPEGEAAPHDGRAPLFLTCHYASDHLNLETAIFDATDSQAFLLSYWGEPVGTEGTLTIYGAELEEPITIPTKVTKHTSWGVVQQGEPPQIPGLELELGTSEGRTTFSAWLESYREEMEQRPVVILVDDDPSQLEILSMVLRHEGFAVVTLDSPSAVGATVLKTHPALVILDYMMPGTDGGTLCKMLKEDPRTAEIPVWLYSSLSLDNLERLADEANADGFLQKGTRPTELAARVRAFFEARLPNAVGKS